MARKICEDLVRIYCLVGGRIHVFGGDLDDIKCGAKKTEQWLRWTLVTLGPELEALQRRQYHGGVPQESARWRRIVLVADSVADLVGLAEKSKSSTKMILCAGLEAVLVLPVFGGRNMQRRLKTVGGCFASAKSCVGDEVIEDLAEGLRQEMELIAETKLVLGPTTMSNVTSSKGAGWENFLTRERSFSRFKRNDQRRECWSFSGQIEGTDLGRNITAADGLAESGRQSAVGVHDETMGCFVAQTMESSVGADRRADLFEAIMGKTCQRVLGRVGVQKPAKFGGLTKGRRKVMAKCSYRKGC
ncbi:hypothetical protein POTOM_060526 [Populus tomentosa]|uniref:Uncharacterized protein n=1 Tax=Populus tomentosa TaxID=118781 RepID=A0A8X7XZV5_POPTO|nr:hypothetical protein POTOM_060526 [Populus tomentosa]